MQTITLTYEDCAEDMRRAIEYEGHKSGNYDALRAIVNDRSQLLGFWQDAITDINNILDKVIVHVTDTTAYSDDAESGDEDLDFGLNIMDGGGSGKSDSYTFTLNVRNSATPVLLKDTMQRRVVATMMVMWLRIVSPDLLTKFQNEEQRCDNQLTALAYFREMP